MDSLCLGTWRQAQLLSHFLLSSLLEYNYTDREYAKSKTDKTGHTYRCTHTYVTVCKYGTYTGISAVP